MSTIKFNFFRFSWKFILKGQFLFFYYLISPCLLYICCFFINLFAECAMPVAFSMRQVRGKAISEFRSPNALPRAPTPLGTEGVLRCCVCCVVDFCLYAAVLRMERWADLVSVFFDTYGGTLCRSAIWFWDSSVLIVVRWADLVPVFFDIYGDTLCRSSSCILRYLW